MVNFAELCKALKASGYDADRAANLFNRVFYYDPDAIDEMRRNTGLFGLAVFGPGEEDV